MKSYAIRKLISNTTTKFALALLIIVKTKRIPKNLKLLVENLNQTSTLCLSNFSQHEEMLKLSAEAYKEDHAGNYHKALSIRTEIKSRSTSQVFVDQNSFPPLIGSRWTQFIGHLSVLALHAQAQKLGLLHQGQRFVLDSHNVANRALFALFSSAYTQLQSTDLARLEFLPNTSPLFEDYHHIKTLNGYSETHSFIELVFEQQTTNYPEESILSKESAASLLSTEMERFIKSRIHSCFVVMHLRNSSKRERRDVDVSSYYKALVRLQREGLQVVNIGPPVEFGRSLKVLNIHDRQLHPYLVSQAEFAITTTSGPALLPGLFGVPNLVTNVTSVGRNMINCNRSTFYLPKKVRAMGRDLSLRQILNSGNGYDEREYSELRKEGIELLNNTDEEIDSAVEWMIEKMQQSSVGFNEIDRGVQKIQRAASSIAKGRLISTYLDTHSSFLD